MGHERKIVQKPRHIRNREGRIGRRILRSITPETSLPQTLSPLFSLLPAEIRSQIYEHTLCQFIEPLCQTRWVFRNDTALLLTCRLVYYEAQAIPLRSATHHVGYGSSDPRRSRDPDNWLHHVPGHLGQHLYHLHHSSGDPSLPAFERFIKNRHLCWKKISWTLYTRMDPARGITLERYIAAVQDMILSVIVLPASCHEFTLEVDSVSLAALPWTHTLVRRFLMDRAPIIRNWNVRKTDGSSLRWDAEGPKNFSWFETIGLGNEGSYSRCHNRLANTRLKSGMQRQHQVVRFQWRDDSPRREYTSLDHIDCLERTGTAT
ncbi:hypothetical protein EJ04DRAFT_214864 [Polyplosphaeria fusca]|uniref:Uncharacterized protein n=1 Tax=Polyplosphaeria fusca TaxID=682080 RepID=A0A9P4V4I7_9PLEO|nr:hypothetical protein EJ04DRAFT_214864 [Polyplosphaeria fusca]